MLKQGHFYFIRDEYFEKYDPNFDLMRNKGDWHGRPCFCAFQDKKNSGIYWFIPVSSRVEKYDRLVEHKLKRQRADGIRNPYCNTIRFGKIMGQRRAFLIQNMFPVSEKYIERMYYDKNTKKPVTIPSATAKDLYVNSKDILKLVTRGYTKLVFSSILKTHSLLAEELQQDFILDMDQERLNRTVKEPTKECHSGLVSLNDRISAAREKAADYNRGQNQYRKRPQQKENRIPQ